MIYLDNAATTKTDPKVVEAMLPYFTENYGNAGTIYGLGSKAKKAMNQARRVIAESLGAKEDEIYFTAGGSESDNWALISVAEGYVTKGKHIITSSIEHHAVLHTCEYLESRGYEVTYLPVDEFGLVRIEDLKKAIRPDTILISIMFANNEIGTIEPIEEIGAVARENDILFHTDAVQVYGQLPIDVEEYHIDLLSASAHKFHGPKGVGFLYIRDGIKMGSLIHGGAQERNRRAGTQNISGIVGMSVAATLSMGNMEQTIAHETMLRQHLISRLETEIADCKVNGHREKRLPGNVNVSFPFLEGESMLIMLDMKGICASSGSACTSGSIDPSHVLTAIGLNAKEAKGSLRLTLSGENTLEEVDEAVDAIKEIAERLRSMKIG